VQRQICAVLGAKTTKWWRCIYGESFPSDLTEARTGEQRERLPCGLAGAMALIQMRSCDTLRKKYCTGRRERAHEEIRRRLHLAGAIVR